jgi:hypothetical protein
MDPLNSDLTALGFAPDQHFDDVAVLESRASDADLGDTKTAALMLAAFVETVVGHDPTFSALPPPPALTARSRCELHQWERAPGLYLVRTDEAVTVRAADASRLYRASPTEVFVDTRNTALKLRVDCGDAVQLWEMSSARVTVRVPRGDASAASPSARALARWAPEVVEVAVPTSAEVFEGLSPSAWMQREVASRLAAGSPWEVTTAWGMAARLCPTTRASSILDVLDAPAPEAPALAWLARHPRASSELASHVVQEADLLAEELDPLANDLAAETVGARTQALAWLHRRDDLASVAFLLGRAHIDTKRIEAALARVDRAAGIRQTMWAFTEPFDDPRLSSAAWQEPESWWAAVATGR